jgi:transposase
MADTALEDLSKRCDRIYAAPGRPSIAPERLLRAPWRQVLYTVRSERLLMEQRDDNFLFRWLVGQSLDDPLWDVTVFTKHRDRLQKGAVAEAFLAAVLAQARQRGLRSAEHFTVAGTLIEAWAGQKSFKLKEGTAAETPPKDDDPGNGDLARNRKPNGRKDKIGKPARRSMPGTGATFLRATHAPDGALRSLRSAYQKFGEDFRRLALQGPPGLTGLPLQKQQVSFGGGGQ